MFKKNYCELGSRMPHQNCPISIDFELNVNSSFPKSAIRTWTTAIAINSIITPPTIYINVLVIWTVLEKQSLRSIKYNLLLALLSLTDLLVGLVAQPIFIAANSCLLLRSCPSARCPMVVAYTLSFFLCVGWSVCTLAVVSVERYLAIQHPFYYRSHVTTKKLVTATAILWMLLPMLFIGRLQTDESYKARQVPLVAVFGLSVAIIFYCVTKVSLTSRRQMRAVNSQRAATQSTAMTQNKIKEYKRIMTLWSLLLASILFYLPSLVIKFIGFIKGVNWSNDFKYTSQHIWITSVHIQSLINPLIVSLRLSHIRAGVYNKFCCRRKSRNQ